MPYIEKLVCIDSTGTTGLVKDSTIDASTARYLPTYKIIDPADPENGIEIGRSTSE